MNTNNRNSTTNTTPLQDITSIRNNSNSLSVASRSKTDTQVDSALLVRNQCARVEDCVDEINRETDDPENMNEKDLRKAVVRMKKEYLPMIKTAVEKEIPKAINNLHAIPGIKKRPTKKGK